MGPDMGMGPPTGAPPMGDPMMDAGAPPMPLGPEPGMMDPMMGDPMAGDPMMDDPMMGGDVGLTGEDDLGAVIDRLAEMSPEQLKSIERILKLLTNRKKGELEKGRDEMSDSLMDQPAEIY
jgi:hypothetical protein